MQFPFEKNCVKPAIVLIETVLSGDSLYPWYFEYVYEVKKLPFEF